MKGYSERSVVFNATFQEYFNYIVVVSFIGGVNRSTRGKLPTFRKSLILSHNVVSSKSRHARDSNSQF